MDTNNPLPLLAGLSPEQFMRRHWQKKPLLVRGAIPGFKPLLSRSELFKLASNKEVESRLIVKNSEGWRMENGPFSPLENQPAKRLDAAAGRTFKDFGKLSPRRRVRT